MPYKKIFLISFLISLLYMVISWILFTTIQIDFIPLALPALLIFGSGFGGGASSAIITAIIVLLVLWIIVFAITSLFYLLHSNQKKSR